MTNNILAFFTNYIIYFIKKNNADNLNHSLSPIFQLQKKKFKPEASYGKNAEYMFNNLLCTSMSFNYHKLISYQDNCLFDRYMNYPRNNVLNFK